MMFGNCQKDQHVESVDYTKDYQHGSHSGIGYARTRPDEEKQDQLAGKHPLRYTSKQVQEMEALFRLCKYPSEHLRESLSMELGLTPIQVKIWFQNRRAHAKIQQDRTDKAILKEENLKLRMENMRLQESLANHVCERCGGPSSVEEMADTTYHLTVENSRLKEGDKCVAAMASNCIRRSVTQLEAISKPPLSISSLDHGIETLQKLVALPLPSTDIHHSPFVDINMSDGYFITGATINYANGEQDGKPFG